MTSTTTELIVAAWPDSEPRLLQSSPESAYLPLDDAEALMLRGAIERHAGNLMRAAEHLGISRQRLYRRMEKYGLQRDEPE